MTYDDLGKGIQFVFFQPNQNYSSPYDQQEKLLTMKKRTKTLGLSGENLFAVPSSSALSYVLLDSRASNIWQAILLFIMQNRYMLYQISHIGFKLSNIVNQISNKVYKISYILYKISYILNKISDI